MVLPYLWHSSVITFMVGFPTLPGEKKLTMYYCVFLILFGVPVYYVLYNAAITRNIKLALVGATMAAMLKLAWGIVPALPL